MRTSLLGETFSPRGAAGAALVFAAVLLVALPAARSTSSQELPREGGPAETQDTKPERS